MLTLPQFIWSWIYLKSVADMRYKIQCNSAWREERITFPVMYFCVVYNQRQENLRIDSGGQINNRCQACFYHNGIRKTKTGAVVSITGCDHKRGFEKDWRNRLNRREEHLQLTHSFQTFSRLTQLSPKPSHSVANPSKDLGGSPLLRQTQESCSLKSLMILGDLSGKTHNFYVYHIM